jgi:GxxExxY protein
LLFTVSSDWGSSNPCERALRVELRHRTIDFECPRAIEIVREGIIVGAARVDLIVDERLVVELKAVGVILD